MENGLFLMSAFGSLSINPLSRRLPRARALDGASLIIKEVASQQALCNTLAPVTKGLSNKSFNFLTFRQTALLSTLTLPWSIAACQDDKKKPFKLPEASELSPKQVLQQSSAVAVAATVQLLQLTTAALINASSAYREAMSAEILLLNQTLEFVNVEFMQEEFNDLLIATRADIQQARADLQELLGFMGYVDKLAQAAAETSFLSGAEYSSFSLSDILFHAQKQVSDQQSQTQTLEAELRSLQQQLVVKSAKKDTPTPTAKETDEPS